MPAAIATTNNKRAIKSANKSTTHANTKKTRIVRRRGRANNGLESDDDVIEREARTDSDTDDNSSVLSDSASDSASDDDDHPTNSFEVVTPSTTQSPPPLHVKDSSNPNDVLPLKAQLLNGDSGPFSGTTDWAQMVAEENATGVGDLPVIDFSELNGHAITQHLPSAAPRTQKQKKQAKKAAVAKAAVTPAARVDDEEHSQPAEPVASTSRQSSRERQPSIRSRGQTPRQAYQHRLESDPSYVPTVGEFWGHDDRLLDKDLRSLSGWWRGRWQSRGRGRGGFSIRGRGGRGGFFPGRVPGPPGQPEGDGGDAPALPDVPPVERAWTHDGFEEMKRREERRRTMVEQQRQQQQQRAATSPQRGASFRGRGGFVSARGRGGFTRGGGPNASSSPSSRSYPTPGQRAGRVWYAMPPEKSWPKHHEYSLYYDNTLKPRSGQGPGIRVKLPGRTGQVIRAPTKPIPAIASSSAEQAPAVRAASAVAPSEDGDRVFTVRMPGAGKKITATSIQPNAPAPPSVPDPVNPTDRPAEAELSIEEVFTVRPSGAPAHIPIIASDGSSPLSSVPQPSSPAALTHHSSPAAPISHLPEPRAQQQLEQILISGPEDANVSAQIEETVLRKAGGPPSIHAPAPQGPSSGEYRIPAPALHPIQTSFSPVPQPSPPYGSPYAYGPMPPGVAMGHHGYPYEVATGRAVYLQPNPPPTMYTPRPMMHPPMGMGHHHSGSMPFIPGHMHHSSVASSSPDFLSPHSHPHTPPVNSFIDPMTGVPIFTPARQSSRIEIRAPGDRAENKPAAKAPLRPSSLRATMAGSDASSQSNGDSTFSYFTQPSESNNTQEAPQESVPGVDEYLQSQSAQGTEPVNVAYPSYQQQYYYPEHYGYQPYMDPHMPSQVVQYEMYPQDHHAPHQPIIYY